MTVVAHNIGYDMLATGAEVYLAELGWTMERPYQKGPVYICRAKKGRARIEFLSSTNYYHARLAEVALAFGERKMDCDFNTTDVDLLLRYCRQDVNICSMCIRWLSEFLQHGGPGEQPLGAWKATIASIAFCMFRTNFMDYPIAIHTDAVGTKIERQSYFGGHTEVWWKGEWNGEAHDVDVNNLYGWVMREAAVPIRLLRVRQFAPADGLLPFEEIETAHDNGLGVIAEVEVDMLLPAIPMVGEQLLFPTGRFRTTLASPELKLVMQHPEVGRVISVVQMAVYAMAPAFSTAVRFLTAKRDEASRNHNEAARRLFKDLVNNLYGKFGQMSEEWERITAEQVPAVLADRVGTTCRETIRVGAAQTKVVYSFTPQGIDVCIGERTESFNSFPAIASFITSYARVRLWKLRMVAEGGALQRDGTSRHALYCDTDALIVDRIGYGRLKAAGELDEIVLGKMKQEWESTRVFIHGNKDYEVTITHQPHLPGKKPTVQLPQDHTPGYEQCGVDEHGDACPAMDGQPTTGGHDWFLFKRKGIPENAKLVQVPVRQRDGTTIMERKFACYQFPKRDGFINAGESLDSFFNRLVLKTQHAEYHKGVILPSGWVRPFRLPDDAVIGIVPGVLAT